MTTRTAAQTRSILIHLTGGQEQIVENIPAQAKLTFGPLQPGSKDFGHRGQGQVLRIYTAANNQLAVFVDVAYFRDLSLTVKTRKVIKASKSELEAGPQGVKASSASEETYEWEAESA